MPRDLAADATAEDLFATGPRAPAVALQAQRRQHAAIRPAGVAAIVGRPGRAAESRWPNGPIDGSASNQSRAATAAQTTTNVARARNLATRMRSLSWAGRTARSRAAARDHAGCGTRGGAS